MAIIEMKTQTCDCVLDDEGKLIERVGDCAIDHVPEEAETTGDGVAVNLTLGKVIELVEREIARLDKLDAVRRKQHRPETFKQTRTLLQNCAGGFLQLGNAVETLSKENEMLKAQLEQDQKRILLP